MTIKFGLGESIYISDLYKVLNDVPGVTDATNVELYNINGGIYSGIVYDISSNLSNDGRFLKMPADTAAEVLVPESDILGVIT